ncbi:MAG: hypothetical protein KDC83_07065 [Flavobacteriales bacterium]|nr:hypothetical protein [Flavobacteriales bacterium]
MNKDVINLIWTAMLSLGFLGLFAQPAQLNHEKRVYKNDGNTYVQKSLPLYLKFSTSPGGEMHDLKSKASADYTDPMYLDTEGVNYIRSKWAVDKTSMKTKQPPEEILYELYADGLAPYTSMKFSGAPKYVSGGKTYFGVGLQYELTSRDGVSGVEKIHNVIGSGSWTDYTGAVSVSNEGEQTLYWYAHDNVGNAENVRNSVFVVDLTAPVSNHAIEGIVYNGNIIAPSTQFSLSKTDGSSGVRYTKYAFDDGSDRLHGGNIGVASLADGDHTLTYYSMDNVKNTETKKTFQFYLDKIPPVVENTVNGDQYKGNYLYVSARTTVSLAATDNKAGVNKIYYRIDETERFDYSSNISFPNVKGPHSLKYDATDNVQNLSPNKYLNVYMDNVSPMTGINYGNPQFFSRDTLFINKETAVTLFAKDYESGVQKIEYKVDGGSYAEYNKFNIPSAGYHTVTFRTTDRVNNVEEEKTSNVYVDNQAPEIYNNFSIQPIGSKNKGGKSLQVYPNYTRLYLGATDDHVGTETIMYSMNDGPLTLYSSPQTLDISEQNRFLKKKIMYTLKIVAKDKLGNTSEKVVEFYVGLQSDQD